MPELSACDSDRMLAEVSEAGFTLQVLMSGSDYLPFVLLDWLLASAFKKHPYLKSAFAPA